MNSLIWFPHAYDEKHAQLGVVHGPGPQRGSMDRVHGVVHGLGPQGWSMDPGPCFVYILCSGYLLNFVIVFFVNESLCGLGKKLKNLSYTS